MRNYGPQLFFFLLISSAILTLACGSSSPRQLQSVSLSPATADAQDYPDGEVPFTATGFYSSSPTKVTPFQAIWGACYQNGTTTEVSVSASGVAQCGAGAAGTYTIWAFGVQKGSGATCNIVTACGGGCGRVTGTAQLTCP